MSSNKNFVDINNLSQFWTNTKNYIDNTISSTTLEYVYIPSIFDETYIITPENYYDFGLSSELNIELSRDSTTKIIEYNFQFRSGNIATELKINGRIIDNTERYCLHKVKILGNIISINKVQLPQYLCIEYTGVSDSNGSFDFNLNNPIEISFDGDSWMTIPANTQDVNISTTDRYLYIKSNITPSGTKGIGSITSTSPHKLSGNIMSLIYGDDFKGKIDMTSLGLPNGLFTNLFKDSSGLTDASCLELSLKILKSNCYTSMFENCTSMINSPDLNADKEALYCQSYIYKNCSKLRKIIMSPAIWASTLHNMGFITGISDDNSRTFYINPTYSSNISNYPINWKYKFIGEPNYHIQYLTFNVLSNGSFSFSKNNIDYRIFSSDGSTTCTWTTLTAGSSTPIIAAGSKVMWRINNPSISNTNGIGNFSSTGKFSVEGNIMSLLYGSNFREKIDLTGKNYAFYGLFANCKNIIDTKNLILPTTTLAEDCYNNMFLNCSSLTTTPELPATTLAPYCYYNMFYNCSSLTTTPELPATTLAPYCYYNMFYNCINLNKITMLATDISASNCLNGWVKDKTSIIGMFKKHPTMTTLPTGSDGIPNGWIIYNAFNKLEGEIDIDYNTQYLTFEAIDDCEFGISLSSTPDSGQLYYSLDDGSTWTILNDGLNTPTISAGSKVLWKSNIQIDGQFGQFTSTGKFNVYGNIMSLLYNDDFVGKIDLLGGFGSSAADMRFMTLFMGVDVVDAHNLILPATTLTNSCYTFMFYGCASLKTAPTLPATTLTTNCYYGIFAECSSLNNITMLATDISAEYCLQAWVENVAATGTFTKASSMTSLPTGIDGIPSGWTVINK